MNKNFSKNKANLVPLSQKRVWSRAARFESRKTKVRIGKKKS